MKDVAPPDAVADFLLLECRERGELLTNLKLQKLLYYADGWYYALHGKPLFEEEFRAWVHGPVLTSQYSRFSSFEWRPITTKLKEPELKKSVERHLGEIIDVFGSETAVSLELMTHRELPWIEARGKLPPHKPSTTKISKKTTRSYFRSLGQN